MISSGLEPGVYKSEICGSPTYKQAKTLMKGVDDITLGMGGAADTLFLSAKSGDPGLQMQQTKAIKGLASSLQSMANEALEGYMCSTLTSHDHRALSSLQV